MIVGLAALDVQKQLLGGSQTMHHSHVDLLTGHIQAGLLERLQPAHLLEVNLLQGLAFKLLDHVAQRRLHHSAGVAEDDSAAGGEAHGHVKGLGFQLHEFNAQGVDHALQFTGADNDVHLRLAVHNVFRQLGLEFFGGAGHHGDHYQVFALAAQLLRQHLLGQGAKHGLGRAAAGDIGQHLGEVGLGILHPGRTAAGEQRQILALLQALEKLVSLLEYGHVSSEAGVIDMLEAH